MSLHRILFWFLGSQYLSGQHPMLSQTSPKPLTGEAQTSGASPASLPSDTAPPRRSGHNDPAELSKIDRRKKDKSGDKIEAKTTMDLLAHVRS